MPLSGGAAGDECTALSVIRGTAISEFDARGDRRDRGATRRARGRASWSGYPARRWTPPASAPASPARRSCARTPAGVARNAGAISESVGEFGNKVASGDADRADPGRVAGGAAAAPAAQPACCGARAPARHPAHGLRPLAADAHRAAPARRAGPGAPVLAAPGGPLRAASPVQDLRAGLRGVRRTVQRRRRARRRSAPSPTGTASRDLGLRAPARRRRAAGAAAAGRLRVHR